MTSPCHVSPLYDDQMCSRFIWLPAVCVRAPLPSSDQDCRGLGEHIIDATQEAPFRTPLGPLLCQRWWFLIWLSVTLGISLTVWSQPSLPALFFLIPSAGFLAWPLLCARLWDAANSHHALCRYSPINVLVIWNLESGILDSTSWTAVVVDHALQAQNLSLLSSHCQLTSGICFLFPELVEIIIQINSQSIMHFCVQSCAMTATFNTFECVCSCGLRISYCILLCLCIYERMITS